MTPERWAQMNDLLHRARQLDRSEHAAFLDQACKNDDELRREVASLLSDSDQAGSSFLRSGQAVGLAKGTRLGDYELQSLLGSGGMGEVHRTRDLREINDATSEQRKSMHPR